MLRYEQDGQNNLKKIFNDLNSFGYDSALTVYHSTIPDYWIRISNILDLNNKIKHMVAIRPYAISPEYCAMMCEAFNIIQSNRLILNVVAGDLHKDETSIDDVLEINDLIRTYEDRVLYTKKWLNKFVNLKTLKNKPEIIVSGTSNQSIENANMYADGHLCVFDNYFNNIYPRVHTKKKMISCVVIIRDSAQEAEEFLNNNLTGSAKSSALYGTEDEVLDRVAYLQNLGVTDIMISQAPKDMEPDKIHKMVKRFTGGR
jgi:alkanesulfonate monooxygenase SsuD/methylene tetrahydromethanopterin reductase-like flavin-dependent oxidoreductase (luciferase family)